MFNISKLLSNKHNKIKEKNVNSTSYIGKKYNKKLIEQEQNTLIHNTIVNIKKQNQIYSIIPLNIFQTWYTLSLPQKMKENVELLKKENPEFKHYLYDDEMCREFIKNNFHEDILYTFNKLMPGAYKADLWRLCILYVYGGIYLDIKYQCTNNYKLINLTKQEYFAKDRFHEGITGIYNAILVCMPNNNILFQSILLIVKNVKNNIYGHSDLDISGPHMMSIFFNEYSIQNLKLEFSDCGNYILLNNNKILKMYDTYREEQNQLNNDGSFNIKNKHKYYKLYWLEKNVYNYPTLIPSISHNYTKELNQSDIILYSGTPTIIELSNNEYLINIRWINYSYNENGTKKEIPKNWISINSRFIVDKYFNKISDEIFLRDENDNEKYCLKLGFEDIRMFHYIDKYYYISTYYDNIKRNLSVASDTFNISNDLYELKINKCVPIMYDINKVKICEKNWVFVNYINKLCIIYNWFPLQIGEIDYNTNEMSIIEIKYNIPEYFKNARGSTCGYIKNNEIWFICHKSQHSEYGNYNYQHFFAIFDLNMNIIRYSELFKLGNCMVEFCIGLIVKDTSIILSYSLLDTQCIISEYDINYINNKIKWYK